MNIEGRASELVAVEEDLEREVALVGEGEVSRVRAVSVILSFNRDGTIAWLNEELVTAEIFIVTVLVASLDGEGEVLEAGVFGICSGFDFEMERSVFDVFALERDIDVNRSGLVSGVGACVCSVAIINDVGVDRLVRAVDFHHERISSVVSGITIVIDSVDGELCWLVVPHVMESLSLSPTLARIASPFDFGVERRIFDGLSVQLNIDVVLSRSQHCIFNSVCSVSIIFEMRGDVFGSGDCHLIRISSLVNWMSICINGMNSEIARLLCLSSMKTRTFSIRMSCICLLHQWMIRTAFDGLSIE